MTPDTLLPYAFPLTALAVAGVLAARKNPLWGWFLFVAFLTAKFPFI